MSAAIRLIVTVILVIWGLVEAVLSARQMPTFLSGVYAFVISAFESLLLIAVVFVIWEWGARSLCSPGDWPCSGPMNQYGAAQLPNP
jgi:hypothetical protein